ncbi:response regulator transcription factor [Candidatus Magnetomonas plexicatena]|uniref:response regulator transcription factor n=1 Tax=Candidatus Magnetomonas plexicatena TaxID=2552947 RepID=UPI001102CF9A|nr:response regulator [Nitrospirales bacterium LBB_01]
MSQKTILIVDDSSLARMMVKNIISQTFSDWAIVEAATGQDGLSHVKDRSVSLALIDFNMPGMNGIDLAAKLMELVPNISIHLVTANIQETMRQRAEAMGIGFIKKPVSKDDIVRVIGALEGGK